jgi:hypothetical protein
MIAMTTSSSMSVNPRFMLRLWERSFMDSLLGWAKTDQ